ncbi:hypothetical protein [Halomonas sp. RA08-2]|uniref:hypothetical protein n=1 Tax=Halomonas sp. RA08-2 TaxID=3440842 RepID=UPI003EE9F65E
MSVTPSFWGWLAASGVCEMLYMGGLAWAYARGEVSLLYPVARALPVVLVALAVSDSVSHIVALRQLSIPLSVLLGFLWLKERAAPAKLVGIAVMLIGLWWVAIA